MRSASLVHDAIAVARAFAAASPVMDAKEIVLGYGDYFTILLTGISSGIFVNNLPLSS